MCNSKRWSRWLLVLCVLSLLLAPVALWAQEAGGAPPVAPPLDLAAMAVVALTPVIIAGLKKLAELIAVRIPGPVLPWLAPFIGALVEWGGQIAGLTSGNPLLGALYGAAGTGLREMSVHIGRHVGVFAPRVTALVVGVALLGGTGCSFRNGEGFTAADAEVITETSASMSASIYLASHPEQRPSFEAAHAALGLLVRSTNVTVSDVTAALQRLPVQEFQGEKGTVVVTAVGTGIGLFVNRVSITNDFALAVARGFYNGLGSALNKPRGDLPPLPVRRAFAPAGQWYSPVLMPSPGKSAPSAQSVHGTPTVRLTWSSPAAAQLVELEESVDLVAWTAVGSGANGSRDVLPEGARFYRLTIGVWWDANPEPTVTHYVIYAGASRGGYGWSATAWVPFARVPLGEGENYIAVTAVDGFAESDYSAELVVPASLRVESVRPSASKAAL